MLERAGTVAAQGVEQDARRLDGRRGADRRPGRGTEPCSRSGSEAEQLERAPAGALDELARWARRRAEGLGERFAAQGPLPT
jgi:hypothetical protein